MNLRTFGLAIVLAGMSCASARATLLDFDFSFTGNPDLKNDIAGTVTGEIIGLQDNTANQVPLDIIIISAPAALGFAPNYDLADNGWNLAIDGTITVSDGQITSATDYVAAPNALGVALALNGLGEGENGFGSINGGSNVHNLGGFSGATYAAVPEPSQYGLFIFLAVAGFIGWKRFSRKAVMV